MASDERPEDLDIPEPQPQDEEPTDDDLESIEDSFKKLGPKDVEPSTKPLSEIEAQGDLATAMLRLEAWGVSYEETEEGVLRIEGYVGHHTLDNISAQCHLFNACALVYDDEEGLTMRFGRKAQ